MLSLVLAVSAAGCAADPAGRDLLAAHRAAMSGAETAAPQVIHYDYRAQGLEGKATLTFDPGSGRFVVDRTLGFTAGASGFDGQTPWMRDLAGFHSSQRGGDKRALAINEAYRLSNAWWRPDAGGARIEMLTCDSLRITPVGGKPFEAWFDSATHRLARVREHQSWNTMVETRYSNYRTSAGTTIAHRVETLYNDDEQSLEVLELTSREPADPADARYARPANPRDAGALPGNGRVAVPFRLLNNHVIVDARINGKGPYPLLVDTGGHDILTPVTARALGLDAEGSATGGGSGEATTINGFTRVASLDVGGAVLRDSVALTLDFSPPDVEGLVLGGMLGSEFLERYVVEFDYGRRVLTFIDPAKFGDRDRRRAGTAVAMDFYDHMPQVAGSFDGVPGRFNLDTGSRSDITVTGPFTARANLRARHPDAITITDGWGSGGPSRSLVVRGERLTLGNVPIDGPIAGLSVATRGVMADENFDGNVGSGLLKRFVVTFDYGGETAYLRRLATPDADTGQFDRSGLWINLA